MKKSIMRTLIFTSVILSAFPVTGSCENLISNGGFEARATDNRPEGWQVNIARETKAETAFDNTEKHSGDYSFRISVAPPGGRAVLYIEEAATGTVSPGETYEASFWVKARNLDYNQFHEAPAFRLNYRPERCRPAGVVDLMAKLDKNADWTEMTVQAPAAPKNSSRVHIDIIVTQGTIWIDDIRVRAAE